MGIGPLHTLGWGFREICTEEFAVLYRKGNYSKFLILRARRDVEIL